MNNGDHDNGSNGDVGERNTTERANSDNAQSIMDSIMNEVKHRLDASYQAHFIKLHDRIHDLEGVIGALTHRHEEEDEADLTDMNGHVIGHIRKVKAAEAYKALPRNWNPNLDASSARSIGSNRRPRGSLAALSSEERLKIQKEYQAEAYRKRSQGAKEKGMTLAEFDVWKRHQKHTGHSNFVEGRKDDAPEYKGNRGTTGAYIEQALPQPRAELNDDQYDDEMDDDVYAQRFTKRIEEAKSAKSEVAHTVDEDL